MSEFDPYEATKGLITMIEKLREENYVKQTTAEQLQDLLIGERAKCAYLEERAILGTVKWEDLAEFNKKKYVDRIKSKIFDIRR
jgi:hypothetical protein